MKVPSYTWFLLTLLVSTIFLTGCEDLYTQDLKKIFKDGKIPKQLVMLQSQFRELSLSSREKIVARTTADAQRKDLLRISVIDSGVDLAHPDLISQIAYTVQNGVITGAGFDILGQTNFASQMLINPSLFAFGSTSANDGQIIGAKDSPLAFIAEINDFFVEKVVAAISSHAVLKNSLFIRLNAKNFTVFGFLDVFEKPQVALSNYKVSVAEKRIIKPDTQVEKDSSTAIKFYAKKTFKEWTFDNEKNTPDVSFENIEHYDLFVKVLLEAYQETESKYELKKHIVSLERFSNANEKEIKFSADLGSVTTLKATMPFILFGYHNLDPIARLQKILREDGRYQARTFKESFQKIATATKSKVAEIKNNPETSKQTMNRIIQALHQLDYLVHLGEYLDNIVSNPREHAKFLSQFRRDYYRSHHPYISEKALSNNHGTHVAGTIAAQSPRIRIVPVRVTTEEVVKSSQEKALLVSNYHNDFMTWITTPFGQAMKKAILKEYKMPNLPNDTIGGFAKQYLTKRTLNIQFIDDLLSSVDYLGSNKIKLANFSLGTVFKKSHSLQARIPSATEDLFAEYVRFKIGERIQTKAPGTLFLIAAGNDGAWVDGVSKTAFPVGITSLRGIEITNQEKLPPPPNNVVKNILAIGSISRGGTLTPFTNIIIDPNTAQIFSLGEDVLSTIPARTEHVNKDLAIEGFKKLSGLGMNLMAQEAKVISKSNESNDDFTFLELKFTFPKEIIELPEYFGSVMHTLNPINRTRMSGTSMASPTATGAIGVFILEKMDRLGITEENIYLHPEFQPSVIIKEVQEIAKKQASQLDRIITVDMLLKGVKEWKTSRAEGQNRKLVKMLSSPRSNSKTCALVIGF